MIKHQMKLLTISILFISFNLFAGELLRYPDLNSDGSKVVFSYQGDLWIMNTNGGKAERITIHEAYDGWPSWSSDNKSIAFSSNRYGNYDIFTIPSEGGIPKRITFHSANDILNDFSLKNNLLFSTARTFKQVEWDSELNVVSSKGGTPSLLLDAVGNMPVESPNGKLIAFARGWGRLTREEYHGSANYDIWIYNKESKVYKKITDFDGHDFSPRWANDNTIYYLSSASGAYNIHKLTLDNKLNVTESKQITNYKNYGIRYFNISGNGKLGVYERQANVYTVDLTNGLSKPLSVNIAADYRFDPVVTKTYSNKLEQYDVSPNGNFTAFVVRGEIFITENDKEKNKTVNLTNSPYRDQQPAWLNDSTLIFVSDREGQYDLYLIKSSDKNESNLFKSLKHKIVRLTETPEDEGWPVISPDHNKIVYEIGRGKLVTANIDKDGDMSDTKTMLDGWAIPGNVSFSPDSRWIAYSLDDLNFNKEIFIQPIDKHIKPVNVSMHPRTDAMPVWSKDGSKLGFISQRQDNDADVWFAWLKKEDWERTKDDWEEYEKPKEDKKDKNDSDKKDDKEVEPIKIDVKNIHERLVRVTSLAGDEGNVEFSKDGETLYFTSKSPTKKGSDLFSVKWDGTEIKEITKDGGNPSNVSSTSDGKFIYFVQKGKLNRIELSKSEKQMLPFNAKLTIDFNLEQNQKFEEAWRALRDGFYDPNYHGHDWNKIKAKYKPWCMAASTEKDFQDMFNYMLGELNASHMGFRVSKYREETQKVATGFLGVRIEHVDNGIKVLHVIDNSPASKSASKLSVGDIITSVNGKKIESYTNFYSLLNNTVKEKVLLNVKRNGKDIEVVIRPTASLKNLLYDEWVENNRKIVDKLSNGRLGYLHIRAMGWPSFERFEREFTAQAYGKDAIVIDVRFNGGGWTTDYLMTVLNYKQHAYTIPRGAAKDLEKEKTKFRDYYPLGERLPYSAWLKPSIALCNQNSYSNAEIFSHAYKNLGIGKLIGMPTFGAVISTGAKFLIDGSYVRMPFRGWFVKADDSNMDFVPAVPDIIVENEPNAKVTGNDAQLKKAVEELMKEIK